MNPQIVAGIPQNPVNEVSWRRRSADEYAMRLPSAARLHDRFVASCATRPSRPMAGIHILPAKRNPLSTGAVVPKLDRAGFGVKLARKELST
jgi:hypothetical protein